MNNKGIERTDGHANDGHANHWHIEYETVSHCLTHIYIYIYIYNTTKIQISD